MSDAPSTDAATQVDSGAGAGLDGAIGDAAALDASRDSQGSVGPTDGGSDAGPADGSTFVCGSANPVTCVSGTDYCLTSRRNGGELPIQVNSCEALAALPCFTTNAGCNCDDLPLDASAGGCRCLESDASFGLTLDCF